MNTSRQHDLLRWLRQQRHYGARSLRLASLYGCLGALVIIAQAALLASLLQNLIVLHTPRAALVADFLLLLLCFILRAGLNYAREIAGYRAGEAIRRGLRQQVLDRLEAAGPAWIQGKPAGSWSTLLLEHIEEMQLYYARYVPQMSLAVCIPAAILLAVFPVNWTAGLILLVSAPLIPLFMALVGRGAADANRRHFHALARLSGDFYDRLRGRETLRLFHRAAAERQAIAQSTADFRQRTMDVLRLAFLSSAVLEFFASLAIAVVAVYFGFSYLGELNVGHYGTGVTLFAGFLALILAPEFFQPLRDLGTFYHAKAQAVGGADALEAFLSEAPAPAAKQSPSLPFPTAPYTLEARNLIILTARGEPLSQPMQFILTPGKRVALIGQSGAGKTALINVLLGFLPYAGSLRVNGQELRDLPRAQWQQQLAWVGQHPCLPTNSVKDNLFIGQDEQPDVLADVLERAGVQEFIPRLPQGLDTQLGDGGTGLSIGQAQRVAVARALLKPAHLLLLDEPASGLDSLSEKRVMDALRDAARRQTTLMITHQLIDLESWDEVWVMQSGQLVQQGPWQTLIEQEGAARDLVQRSAEESRG